MNEGRRASTASLVAVNLIPLIGVLFFDWTLLSVMLLFWAENLVVGGFNVAKMACVALRGVKLGKLINIPGFIVHYGGFNLILYIFLLEVFGDGEPPEIDRGMVVGVIGFAVSHAVSFVVDFLIGGERLTATMDDLMFAPYPRVAVLHISAFLGGFFVLLLGAHWFPLILLVLFKIGIDANRHRAEGRAIGIEEEA